MTSTQARGLRDFPGYGPLNGEPVDDRYARPNAKAYKAQPVPEAMTEYDKQINNKVVPLEGMLPVKAATAQSL